MVDICPPILGHICTVWWDDVQGYGLFERCQLTVGNMSEDCWTYAYIPLEISDITVAQPSEFAYFSTVQMV